MKNATFGASLRCAAAGLFSAWKTEKNFKYYTIIAALFLIMNLILHVSVVELAVFLVLCGGVYALEYVNTAMERLVDQYTEEINEHARFIKDVSAAAVLVQGIVFFVVEGMILLSKIG